MLPEQRRNFLDCRGYGGENGSTEAAAECAGLGNHSDNDDFRGRAASQSQLREALCKPRIMTSQMERCPAISKVGFPKVTQCARLPFRFDRIHDYGQMLPMQVRR